MIDAEIWRDVPGFDGYQASNAGRIRSNAFGYWRVSKAKANHGGYITTHVKKNGQNVTVRVHALVALAWIGPSSDRIVNHKDGIKTNNAPENLEYVTSEENNSHARETGLWHPPPPKRGENNGRSRFTEDDIRAMRKRWRSGDSQTAIAKDFNCHKGVVSTIVRGCTWKHVKEAA
jgi:hypothetical protein